MKQTAVEWLVPKILELNLQLSLRRISQRNCELEILRLFEQAKAMEKEQIMDAWNNGIQWEWDPNIRNSEEYYNKTFKSE